MATNRELIEEGKWFYYKQGILKPKRFTQMEIYNADGEPEIKEIPILPEIHTYKHWESLGYKVRKGEKSYIRITIWKHGKAKESEDGEILKRASMFLKESCFFTEDQVDKIH